MSENAKTIRAYLFKGDDEFRKQKELESLLPALVAEDYADFDLEKIDGDVATSERVLTAILIPPLGSPRRVVLVRQANKMNAEEQEKLASRLQGIPQSSCLILVNPAPERKDGKPRKGSEVKSELAKAVKAVGEVRDFRAKKGMEKTAEARRVAQSIFSASGKTLEPAAMTVFAQRTGEDLTVLRSEAEKLITYCWDSEQITASNVDAVTSETPEEKIFKLLDAVAARSQGQALKLLDELFSSGDEPKGTAPRALSMIARQFRLIWQMRILKEAGVTEARKDQTPEAVRNMLSSDPNLLEVVSRQLWMGEKLARQAARFNTRDLCRCFEAIARADRMLKGIEPGVEDPQAVMELLVMELARGK